jgi:hypothetical protein
MMKKYLCLLFGACLACGLVLVIAPETFAATRHTSVSGPQSICIGDPIPAGYVIVARSVYGPECGGLETPLFPQLPHIPYPSQNFVASTVKPAPAIDQDLTVCAESPIPDGYVVTTEVPDFDCGLGETGKTITLASGNSVTICQDSPLPASYTITGETFRALCNQPPANPWFANNAFVIQPKPVQPPTS